MKKNYMPRAKNTPPYESLSRVFGGSAFRQMEQKAHERKC